MIDCPTSFLLIIGAAKAGTTALATWLGEHPELVLCNRKEPRFFTDFGSLSWTGPGADRFMSTMISDESRYLSAFEGKPGARWAIDASTDYLWCDKSPRLIEDWATRFQTKVICILRDPVERAISEYQHTVRDRLETGSLGASLQAEEDRFKRGWQPLFYHGKRSHYDNMVKIYTSIIPPQDILLLDFHSLTNIDDVRSKIERFINLATPINSVEIPNVNKSYVYRSNILFDIFTNQSVVKLARGVLPGPLRRPLRSQLNQALRRSYNPSIDEWKILRELLSEEILRCRSNPLIVTSRWKLSEKLFQIG
jgi:hypothetical protein